MEKNKELPLCPVETTVGLISNKWKILILRELLSGTKRFGELRTGIEGISQKVLTQNLRSMEEDGIIQRQVYAEVPPRVEYSLSDLGNSLRPIIDAMAQWGLGYQEMARQ
jgi:DNA-binding HxlR family transcriptional regulator